MKFLIPMMLVVVALSVYAWRDWYKALCGLIVFSAFMDHPDMPRAVLNIPGLNAWNLIFFNVLGGWICQRKREGLRWDMPRGISVLLRLGLFIFLFAFLRLDFDLKNLVKPYLTTGELISDTLINPVKWVVAGLLLFYGCRDRRRLVVGLVAILALYVLISLQIIRWVLPSGALEGGQLSSYTIKKLRSEIGYHRNDLSVMLAGAFWALLAMKALARSLSHQATVLAASGVVLFAQILTGGRGGYVAWCVVGATFGFVRWRRYLLLAPVVVLLVATVLPAVAERALQGTQAKRGFASEEIDLDELTAGRNLIWPRVIEKIAEAPFLGYGRAAIQRIGVTTALMALYGEGLLEHPHNAYLEMLLDAGLVGFVVTLGLHGAFVAMGVALVRERQHPEFVAAGGAGLALVLAQLVGSVTGQSFWPHEATLGMWCAVGLMIRAHALRAQRSPVLPKGEGDGRRARAGMFAGWNTRPGTATGAPLGQAEWWRRTPTAPIANGGRSASRLGRRA